MKIPGRILMVLWASLFLVMPIFVFATSGACSYHGGVNCAAGSDWDGSVICNDGWRDSSVAYSSMVMCGGYYSTPSCPLFSSYDSLSGSCKCDYGYVVDGYGGCEYGNTFCHRKYGYNSSYKSYSSTCECDYGYVFDSSDQCVSKDSYCQDLYGYGAQSNYLTDKCECKLGYEFVFGQCRLADNSDYYMPSNVYQAPIPISCPINSHLVGSSCSCDDGYQANIAKTECVVIPPTPKPLICSYGFLLRNGECISNTQDCINSFGLHVIGVPGKDNNSSCDCDSGYQWSNDKTACIEIIVTKPSPSSVDFPKAEQPLLEDIVPTKKALIPVKKQKQEKVNKDAIAPAAEFQLYDTSTQQMDSNKFSEIKENQYASALSQSTQQKSSVLNSIKKFFLKFKFW